MRYLIIIIISLIHSNYSLSQNIVTYNLYVKDTIVNYSGKTKRAISVNGKIPMPELKFQEGDSAIIYVHNKLNKSTSFHWHGLLVPNEQDGVPYLTTAPIKPNTTHMFTFKLRQSGTYWYHSHTKFQEQIGMYGSLTVYKKVEDPELRVYDKIIDFPILLSEWTDEKPSQIQRNLHNATDWYAIKKNSVQSYFEAIKEKHFKTKFINELKRMHAMDVSDVYYDAFLINGKKEQHINSINDKNLNVGDEIRLRIANGGASSYFWINYSGGKFKVIANDGMDVEPVEVDRLIIGVAETYDIIIKIPDVKSYELLATPEDRSGHTSIFFGNGEKVYSKRLPKLKYFQGMKMMNNMMNMDGSMDDMGMNMSLQKMDMNEVMYPELDNEKIITLNYSMLKSPKNTLLPKKSNVRELNFVLTGNMNRYVWSINNKTLSETDKILIKKGENVKITLTNNSMMRHPMHLHGHFFRVINGMGDNSPLKNVIDIMPMETDTIEFNASEKYGNWFFHCHILYHMMSGMGRVFTYEDSPDNKQIKDVKFANRKFFNENKKFHIYFENDFSSSGNDGKFRYHNTRWSIDGDWRAGYNAKDGYEVEFHVGRYIGQYQWFKPFIGYDTRDRKIDNNQKEKNIFGQYSKGNKRSFFSLGFVYTLPLLIDLQGEIYENGNLRFQLSRDDIPISKRLRMAFMINSDKEYMFGLYYILNKNLSISSHYDSDMKTGIGIKLTY
jgi:FtsP/CotA-like multicopper oxidase with cupredoxin domain